MKNPIAQIAKIGVVMLVVTLVINILTALSEAPFVGTSVVLVVSGVALALVFPSLKKKVSRKLRKVTRLFS